MTGEAEAIYAADQANQTRMLVGAALALLGLILFFFLLARSRRKSVSMLAWLCATMLIIGGLFLANWQVYS